MPFAPEVEQHASHQKKPESVFALSGFFCGYFQAVIRVSRFVTGSGIRVSRFVSNFLPYGKKIYCVAAIELAASKCPPDTCF